MGTNTASFLGSEGWGILSVGYINIGDYTLDNEKRFRLYTKKWVAIPVGFVHRILSYQGRQTRGPGAAFGPSADSIIITEYCRLTVEEFLIEVQWHPGNPGHQ